MRHIITILFFASVFTGVQLLAHIEGGALRLFGQTLILTTIGASLAWLIAPRIADCIWKSLDTLRGKRQ